VTDVTVTERKEIVAILLDAARAAGELVMRVYQEDDVGVELKGPNDPVTRADKEANALLLDRLGRAFPGVPIVAEESDPATFEGFGNANRAFFVDPVDGTREFIAKNGEFCVMIGYVEDGRATAGVIVCPALAEDFTGAEGEGAFEIKGGSKRRLHVNATPTLEEARAAVSRFQRSRSVDAKLAALHCKELVEVGSAGIKGVRVATGVVDLFAHPSRGAMKLWDACAPDAIVRAAGGTFTDATGRPYDYKGTIAQGAGTLAGNPTLHAEAIKRFATASGA
jgi:3'(2'), 5'-bisphosphate nucleotidase